LPLLAGGTEADADDVGLLALAEAEGVIDAGLLALGVVVEDGDARLELEGLTGVLLALSLCLPLLEADADDVGLLALGVAVDALVLVLLLGADDEVLCCGWFPQLLHSYLIPDAHEVDVYCFVVDTLLVQFLSVKESLKTVPLEKHSKRDDVALEPPPNDTQTPGGCCDTDDRFPLQFEPPMNVFPKTEDWYHPSGRGSMVETHAVSVIPVHPTIYNVSFVCV
jgi:hypothetical protein